MAQEVGSKQTVKTIVGTKLCFKTIVKTIVRTLKQLSRLLRCFRKCRCFKNMQIMLNQLRVSISTLGGLNYPASAVRRDLVTLALTRQGGFN